MVLSSSSPFLKFRSYFCGGVSGDTGAEEPAWAPRHVQPPPSEPWVAEPSGQPPHRHAQRVEHCLDLHIIVIDGAGASRKSLTQLRTWEGGEHVGTAQARTGRADLARAPPRAWAAESGAQNPTLLSSRHLRHLLNLQQASDPPRYLVKCPLEQGEHHACRERRHQWVGRATPWLSAGLAHAAHKGEAHPRSKGGDEPGRGGSKGVGEG